MAIKKVWEVTLLVAAVVFGAAFLSAVIRTMAG
jgi:hypothetical protein